MPPRSWTAFANLLFLDTPAATGFTAAAAAGTPDDASSTAATLAALQAFYAKFPGAQKLRLFLAGQGYAGAGCRDVRSLGGADADLPLLP